MKKIILFCVTVFTILNYFGYLESKRKANISYTKTYKTQISSISSGNLPENVLYNKKYCYPNCDSDVDSSYRFTDDYKFYFSLAGKTIRKGTWAYSNGFVKTYDNDGKSKSQDIQVISDRRIKVNSTTYIAPEIKQPKVVPCSAEGAKAFAIKEILRGEAPMSTEIEDLGNNEWMITFKVDAPMFYTYMVQTNKVKCKNGSYEIFRGKIEQESRIRY